MRINTKVRALAATPALALVFAACSGNGVGVDSDYLQLSKLEKIECTASSSSTVKAELKEADDYVSNLINESSSREFEDVLVLNPGERDLADLREALKVKLADCNKVSASSTPTPTSTPTPSASPTTVVDEFTIKMPKRDGNRLNAAGIDPKKRGNAQVFKDQILAQAKTDPLTLFMYYQASPLGTIKPLANESVLAKDGIIKDGNVYSELGRKAYKEWAAMWVSPLTKAVAVKEISFTGFNSGVDGTKITHSKGVTGTDLSGVNFTYYDAQGNIVASHSALDRCTQVTTSKPIPGTKPGKTDNPPMTRATPPTKSTPPPPKRNSPKKVADHSDTTGDAPSDGWKPAPRIDETKEPVTPPGGGTPPKTYAPAPTPTPSKTTRPDPPEPPPTSVPVPSTTPTCDPDICGV